MGASWWIRTCWAAVGGETKSVESLEVVDPGAWLGGPLPVDGLAVGAVAACLLAAADLADARGAGSPVVGLSAEHAALSFCSERHVLVGGSPAGPGFAPLSQMLRCADGWARTHGNYPHHAAALARALEIDVSGDAATAVTALEAAVASRRAISVEDAVVAAGGCAASLRSAEEWNEHPAGRAASAPPLIAWREELATLADRPAVALSDRTRPAAGFRVLDLTRVIAGPVAGRTLAALGADVLRIDPPGLPELPGQHTDTGPGKRSAFLDLGDCERREALLDGADVVLLGYRPGALKRFGLEAEQLAERHPRVMQVSLSAWGTTGPWAQRRGFDSLVQVATGIAAACASSEGTPGVLPAQALDHATGHLMAAAALHGLAQRSRDQPIRPAGLSLARTARELLSAPRPERSTDCHTGRFDPESHRVIFADVALISPPGTLDDRPLRWAHGPRTLGSDKPTWNGPRSLSPRRV